MKVILSKQTDPVLVTASVNLQRGDKKAPFIMHVVHDEYSGAFVLVSRCITDNDEDRYDLVWKGDAVTTLNMFSDIVGDALIEQFGNGA